MDHDMVLRTWPGYFRSIWRGQKRAELRKNDRGFQVGDRVLLIEFDPNTGRQPSPSRDILVVITHLIRAEGIEGMENGYCMWSFNVIRRRIHR